MIKYQLDLIEKYEDDENNKNLIQIFYDIVVSNDEYDFKLDAYLLYDLKEDDITHGHREEINYTDLSEDEKESLIEKIEDFIYDHEQEIATEGKKQYLARVALS